MSRTTGSERKKEERGNNSQKPGAGTHQEDRMGKCRAAADAAGRHTEKPTAKYRLPATECMIYTLC